MIAGSRRGIPQTTAAVVGLIGGGAAITVAVASGQTLVLIAAVVGLVALAVGIHNWRWSIYGLLFFMPFSGLPVIAAYPHTEIPVLLKDFLFIIPAYIGFVLALKGRSLGFRSAPLILIAGIVLLIGIQSIPKIATPLTPLVGAKVWLLYIPCLFLGYQLVQDRTELVRMLRWVALAGMFPLIVGIIEAALLDTGQGEFVYRLYGPAAQAVTQQFYNANFEGGTPLLRVPSTFSFVGQYYEFTGFMIVLTFAYWRLTGSRWGATFWAVSIVASLSSGTRAGFVLTPFLIIAMVVLTRGARQTATATSMALLGLMATAGLLGLGVADTFIFAAGIGTQEFQAGFMAGIPTALGLTLTGFGTGHATGATRFVLGDTSALLPYDPSFSESWWVKIILELGLPGLLLFGALLAWLLLRAYRAHRAIRDPRLAAVSGAMLALLLWVLLYSTKGPAFDLDPLNVYFWLFAGMLLRLPSIDRATEPEPIRSDETDREPYPLDGGLGPPPAIARPGLITQPR